MVLYTSPKTAFPGAFLGLPRRSPEVFPAYDSPRTPRLLTVVIFFAVCAFAGSILQRRVGAQSSADESQLRDSLKSFTNVYALVEQNYAEPINGDKAEIAIYDGAIPGMLRCSTRTPTSTTPRPTPKCARSSVAAITAWA
jgi:hypothetical protein